ncbi:MAG: single-stranded-DNA-specific exonuclease RecJ [Anaerolineaceae bacterium]|nr:single-stranded-DNA-specific exonuclease RecJ [Anaerolineaceae bacterium]
MVAREVVWREATPEPVPAELREAVGGHPLVAQTLAQRGILTPVAARRFLDPAHYSPAAPDELPDMEAAVACLQRVIRERGEVLVWGDFDVDGQTATALLVTALRYLGARVRWHVPNRFREGHGLHTPTLRQKLGDADLLLTCDTGIGAHDALAWAQGQGAAVVVTDHHKLTDSLPPASAVINPQRLAEGHALRELPGVGTAFKLVEALYGSRNCEHLLDLVALGIVADVMCQVDDTRWLLQRGLHVLRATERPGLRALMAAIGIRPAALTESDIGYALAPRLNSFGRLADASAGVELLTGDDPERIAALVKDVEELNRKRRFLTQQVEASAQQQIERDPSLLDYAALVLSQPGWHGGVLGIVAGQLAEAYGCPTLLLGEQGSLASGSARSVAGCDIVAALDSQADLLGGYGGHSMAAGLRMDAAHLPAFRRGLSRAVREQRGDDPPPPELQIDASVKLEEVSLELARQLGRLAPFGNGNPPLTLMARDLRLLRRRQLDRRGDHLELTVADSGDVERRVIWWSGDAEALPRGLFDMAFTLRENEYRGQREALLEWQGARVREGEVVVRRRTWETIDCRRHPAPRERLAELLAAEPDALVWREGGTDLEGVDRFSLRPAGTLVVWSIPPDAVTWQAALKAVGPQKVALFAQEPPCTTAQELLKLLAGMAKFALRQRDGVLSLDLLAVRAAQPQLTIQTCIEWLDRSSQLRFARVDEDQWVVTRAPDGLARPPDRDIGERLRSQMLESAAWRRHWRRRSFSG